MAQESHWWNGQKKCAVGSISPWHLGRDLIWPRRQVYTGTLSWWITKSLGLHCLPTHPTGERCCHTLSENTFQRGARGFRWLSACQWRHGFDPWSRKILRATEQLSPCVRHSCWGCALRKPLCPGAHALQPEKSPCTKEDAAQPKINQQDYTQPNKKEEPESFQSSRHKIVSSSGYFKPCSEKTWHALSKLENKFLFMGRHLVSEDRQIAIISISITCANSPSIKCLCSFKFGLL